MNEMLDKFNRGVVKFCLLSILVTAIAVLLFIGFVTRRNPAFLYLSITFLGAGVFLLFIYLTQISMELKSKTTGSPFGEEREHLVPIWRMGRVYKVWRREISAWAMPLASVLAVLCVLVMTYELQAVLKEVAPTSSVLHYVGAILLFYGPLVLMLILLYKTSGLLEAMWAENPLSHRTPFHLLMARPEINALKSAEARIRIILMVMLSLVAIFTLVLRLG